MLLYQMGPALICSQGPDFFPCLGHLGALLHNKLRLFIFVAAGLLSWGLGAGSWELGAGSWEIRTFFSRHQVDSKVSFPLYPLVAPFLVEEDRSFYCPEFQGTCGTGSRER